MPIRKSAFSGSVVFKQFALCGQVSFAALCLSVSVMSPTSIAEAQTAGSATAVTVGETDELKIPLRIGRRASPLGHYLAARHAEVIKRNDKAADLLAVTMSRYPTAEGLQDARLSLLAAEGRLDEARVLADKVLRTRDDNRDAIRVKFYSLVRAGKWAEAETIIKDLTPENFDLVLFPLGQSWAAAERGESAEAIDAIEPLVNFKGLEALVYLQEALVHDVTGSVNEATEAFEKTLSVLRIPTLRLTDLIGNFYERNGQPERAREIYDAFIGKNPHEVLVLEALDRLDSNVRPEPTIADAREGLAEILYHLAGVLFADRSDRLSISLGQTALYLDPENQFYRLQTGQMMEDQERWDDAITNYNGVPADSPLQVRARLLSIDVLMQQKRWDEAETQLKEIAEIDGFRFNAINKLADLHREKEEFSIAADYYDTAINEVATQADLRWYTYYYAGIANEQAKNWDKAEVMFKEALEMEPDQPDVLNYLAYSWVDKGLHLDKSLDMLKTAVEKRPQGGYIIDSLGWVYYKLGRFDEAVEQLERAVELRPGDPIINDHLGDAYFRVGRKKEASFQWRLSLSFKPKDEQKEQLLEKIEKGLEDLVEETAIDDEIKPEGQAI